MIFPKDVVESGIQSLILVIVASGNIQLSLLTYLMMTGLDGLWRDHSIWFSM